MFGSSGEVEVEGRGVVIQNPGFAGDPVMEFLTILIVAFAVTLLSREFYLNRYYYGPWRNYITSRSSNFEPLVEMKEGKMISDEICKNPPQHYAHYCENMKRRTGLIVPPVMAPPIPYHVPAQQLGPN